MGWAVGTELNVKKPKTENKKGLEGTHCKANGPPSLSKIASYVYNSGARSRFVPRPNSEMRGFYSPVTEVYDFVRDNSLLPHH